MANALRIVVILSLAGTCAVLVSLGVGSAAIPASDVVSLLVKPDGSVASEILHHVRLPRTLAAFAAGALLSVAGALMQALLRNPLADPYVLGLSSASAVGALAAMMAGLGAIYVDGAALLGALASVALVFAFARRDAWEHGAGTAPEGSARLLLTGVILAAGWSAIVALLLTVAPEGKLRGMIFWLIGDLDGADSYAIPFAVLVGAVAWLMPFARELNVMLAGDDPARALGVDTIRVRRVVLLTASLLTAIAVTTAGSIGFVGLIVPHALRLAIGNDQRVLIPASAAAGGALLVLADCIARSAFAPQQVPVGVITCMLGVPSFLYLLARRYR